MSLPYMPVYVTDLLGDARVATMTPMARGGYYELLFLSWQLGPLKDPGELLKRRGWGNGVWDEIRPCWDEGEDGWIQARLEKERTTSLDKRTAASERGRRGAEARWGKGEVDG